MNWLVSIGVNEWLVYEYGRMRCSVSTSDVLATMLDLP